MKYIKSKKSNPMANIGMEKSLIERHYNFINCKIQKGTLYCYGNFQPSEESDNYQYRIKYAPPLRPKVHVRHPIIEYNDEIHMYPKDNSLCLYHKSDMVWTSSTHHLYDTIIPWTHEWFVFYELFKIEGKWLHPFVPHQTDNKK